MVIDLRSDTLTKPTDGMRKVMWGAEMGDDCYGEDPTVKELETRCTEMFGKDQAVFMPSGTMSNQIAIRCNTSPGDELILHSDYHINFFESAQTADLAKVVLNPRYTHDGILTVKDIEDALNAKPRSFSYAQATLVSVENTINAFSGKVFPYEELFQIHNFLVNKQIRMHMDGARLFNAIVATGLNPSDYGAVTDSLCVCFAKGLGAPAGSILLGDEDFAERARRYRKWYGGGLHQSGVLAAAALYALDFHIDRLIEDHENARRLAEKLAEIPFVHLENGKPETNIVMFDTSRIGIEAIEFVESAKSEGILLFPWSKYIVRAITHIGISKHEIDIAAYKINQMLYEMAGTRRYAACAQHV